MACASLSCLATEKKNDLDSEDKDNFTIGASTLVGTFTAFCTIIWIFSVFEIEFFAFLTSIALFSVALATIFKDTIQDFIEGLAILFTANYKVGDYVQVGSHPKGMIIDITLSKMKLKLEDGSVLHISNHTVNSSAVINLSETRLSKIKITLPVPKKVGLEKFSVDLTKVLEEELDNAFLSNKTTFTINETDGEKLTIVCEVAVTKYSFAIERRVKNVVQGFASTLQSRNKSK